MAFLLSQMQVTSESFHHMGKIPKKYSGEGEDISPHLTWEAAPEEAKSFVVIAHDPDAPLLQNGIFGFVHWLLYNIPAGVHTLEEATSFYTKGLTDAGTMDYVGPMPPKGHGRHYYYFMVIALDEDLSLNSGLTIKELLNKIEPHALGMNRLIGSYER